MSFIIKTISNLMRDKRGEGKLSLKGFILFAFIIYGGFIVSDWISKGLGLDQYGIGGTLVILALPVGLSYIVLKKYLWREV
jgi:hypothetical protein